MLKLFVPLERFQPLKQQKAAVCSCSPVERIQKVSQEQQTREKAITARGGRKHFFSGPNAQDYGRRADRSPSIWDSQNCAIFIFGLDLKWPGH
jgi:hypothetical protein